MKLSETTKDLLTNKANELDLKIAAGMDYGRERTGAWLGQYTRLIGLALLVGVVVAISMHLYLVALILACTLHTQIIVRYSYRTAEGIDLWTNQKKTDQKASELGSKQPPNSAQ